MNSEIGWKPEGFMRKKFTESDVQNILKELEIGAEHHLKNYGDGIFCHPHEIVGCMYGQQMKLSKAADESIYSGELKEFRARCSKTIYAMLVGMASVDKLIELRKIDTEKGC